jgi:CBS domain-containing protein
MRIREIMSTNVEAVRPGETLERAGRRMRRRGIHHLVVVAGHKVLGVVSEAALETRLAEGVATVQDAMFRHLLVASPDMTVTEAARMMRGRPEGALPIVGGRRLVGIVTISDLLDVLGQRSTKHPEQRSRPGVARRTGHGHDDGRPTSRAQVRA